MSRSTGAAAAICRSAPRWAVTISVLAVLVVPLHAQALSDGGATGLEPSVIPKEQDRPVVPNYPENNGCSRRSSLVGLARNVLCDQKEIWAAPLHSKAHLRLILPLAGVTAALIATDKYMGDAVTDHPPGTAFRVGNALSPLGTEEASLVFVGAYYGISRITRHERSRKTALLSFEALADAAVVLRVVKAAANRERPADLNGDAIEGGRGSFWGGGTSFISGHATTTWALASVIAARYPEKRWVRLVCYGIAGMVSVSRIMARRHFPSDVIAGSTFGFLIGQYVARSQPR